MRRYHSTRFCLNQQEKGEATMAGRRRTGEQWVIESYQHPGEEWLNNPPVGLGTPVTDLALLARHSSQRNNEHGQRQ
jgi:hypothetical protein